MKTDLSIYNNDWYKTGGSLPKRLLWIIVSWLFFTHSLAIIPPVKVFLLRLFGARIGKKVMIKPNVRIKYPWNLVVENYAWIGEDVWIDNLAKVSIGESACISQGAMLLTGNHDFTKITFDLIVKPIVLEEGVWIGAKAVVCPGVKCFSHAVLSVNSVATKDLEAYAVYQGNPSIKVKDRIISNII